MRTLLFYHRHDLRLHDNAVLEQLKASNTYTHFLPIYIFPPHQLELAPLLRPNVSKNPEKSGDVKGLFGTWRCGNFRIKYLCESVWNLKQNYKKHGSDLIIAAGRAESILPSLIQSMKQKESGEVDLWMQDEYTKEEQDEVERIKVAIKDHAGFHMVEENTLVARDDLPYKSIEKLPNMYTEFRKAVEPLDHVREPYTPPEKLPSAPQYEAINSDYEVPDNMNECIRVLCDKVGGVPKVPEITAHPMTGGEDEAIKRLFHYIKGGKDSPAAHYKETRNQMLGPDFSTKFSSFLSLGTISPKFIHHTLNKFEKDYGLEGNGNTYWIRFELLWRDYFKFVALKYGAHVFRKWGLKQKHLNDKWKGVDAVEAKRWKTGTTGVGIVDAAMRELNQTGYMSNRTRQIVASFLVELKLDWRIGAEHFEEKLLDHDASSNWCNWQYLAGIGNDPRGNRRFNPAKQTHDYDPEGKYIKTWCPEVKDCKEKNGHVYFWSISQGERKRLGIEDLPGVCNPIKGLCGGDGEKKHYDNKGGGRGKHYGKARRGDGRPRRGEGGRLAHDHNE